MSRQLPDPERCPPPPRGRARAVLVLVLVLGAVRSPAALALESLSSFPHSQLSIQTQAGMQHFDIWVADTAQRSEQGLMFVHSLPPASGMLFPLERPGAMRMWMKNTLIPLDMLFIDVRGEIIYIQHKATPESEAIITTPAMVVTPVKAVLELAGGECDRRHIQQGDRVIHFLFRIDAR
jgi:uncharacterized membrane protein (UPF0127 family)